MRFFWVGLILFALISANACGADTLDFPANEVYRIRILNQVGGLVQVSLDGGRTYCAVGRVQVAANTRITGFSASSYTPQGKVAATAVHGIRIKTGQAADGLGKAQMPEIFSIIPKEFSSIPHGYGGHIPRSSAIQLDTHTGRYIFRNFSPYVGNPVYIERNHSLKSISDDYIPIIGDTYVIIVKRPALMPKEIDFENKVGGEVNAVYPTGRVEKIATVQKTVSGVGRYDATTFTGVGAVNTNHGGVLTISTAPVCPFGTREGGAVETRGGFMVQPDHHAHEQGERSPQVMIVKPVESSKEMLEGHPPLFFGYINLAWQPNKQANSYKAQIKIDDGEWEDLPEMVGRIDNAFTPDYLTGYFERIGKPRKVEKGVTAIRLLFPEYETNYFAHELALETAEYARISTDSGTKVVRGTVAIKPAKDAGSITTFYIDGRPAYSASTYGAAFDWDTTRYSNGFHEITIESDQSLLERLFFLVMN